MVNRNTKRKFGVTYSKLVCYIESCMSTSGIICAKKKGHSKLKMLLMIFGFPFCSNQSWSSFIKFWLACPCQLLTAPVLIGRLINANQHFLALRISEYLNLNPVILFFCCLFLTLAIAQCLSSGWTSVLQLKPQVNTLLTSSNKSYKLVLMRQSFKLSL